MDENLFKVILAIVGGIFATTIGFRLVRKSKKDSTKTKQSGNIVGGDQAGRDINK